MNLALPNAVAKKRALTGRLPPDCSHHSPRPPTAVVREPAGDTELVACGIRLGKTESETPEYGRPRPGYADRRSEEGTRQNETAERGRTEGAQGRTSPQHRPATNAVRGSTPPGSTARRLGERGLRTDGG